MKTLVLADHDNASLKEVTARAVTAAQALGGEVDVLVAGQGARAAAEQAAKLAGVSRVRLAEDAALAHQLAEPLAALLVSLAPEYDVLAAPATAMG
jgi:electron transfer flavoprotein alpha subunit